MNASLRMTERQYRELHAHLFPGDGLEAVALLLCGRHEDTERPILTVRRIVLVPHDQCVRKWESVTWPTDLVIDLLTENMGGKQAIVKIHGHGGDYRRFSPTDDQSDQHLFEAIGNFLEDGLPHASVVLMEDGELFGRTVNPDGQLGAPLRAVPVIGDSIHLNMRCAEQDEKFALRHAQAFGRGTTSLLRNLSVAVVGCSGTGSIVIEQLARLGLGRFVLVDPDVVEDKNLNRILNTTAEDARKAAPKVEVAARFIRSLELGQIVVPLQKNLMDRSVVHQVASCDMVFGCMDGVEGRHLLNRLATFYTLPYFDVGIRLDADGNGGIDKIAGAVHYLQPGRSSLLSRGVYSMARLQAEELKRTDPEAYRIQVAAGYVRGVDEDRPAVISVNMLFASLTVNEMLARLHAYRIQPNSDYSQISVDLTDPHLYFEGENEDCELLRRHVGRGDVEPPLERPALS
jgi:ThiF family protein/JAB domain-containing protein similar to deubiquitination enzymes